MSLIVWALRQAAVALSAFSRRHPSERRPRASEPARCGTACGQGGRIVARLSSPILSGSARALALAGALLLSLGAFTVTPAHAQTPSASVAWAATEVTEGTRVGFTVTLSEPAPPGGLVVWLRISDTHAMLHPAHRKERLGVTVAAGRRTFTWRVFTVDDLDHEATGTVRLEVLSGRGYSGAGSFAEVRVLDNDPPRLASVEAAPAEVTAGEEMTFTVRLSSPAVYPGVKLGLVVRETGADYVAADDEGANYVRFRPGERVKMLKVATGGDAQTNGTVRAAIAMGSGYQIGTPFAATVKVKTRAGPRISPTRLTVNESGPGNTAVYRVVLGADPGVGARVTVTSDLGRGDDSKVTVAPGSLTFTGGPSGDWNRPRTVIVTAVDDDIPNSFSRIAGISHRVSGLGSLTEASAVRVLVTDDDAPDTAPAFAADAAIPDVTYYVDTRIFKLEMPKASGGNGLLTYSLTPDAPPGLTFTANTLRPCCGPLPGRLTGTPTEAQPATRYAYTVTDSDGQSASLNFTIEIREGAPPPEPMVTGLRVDPVPGEPTKLDVSWTAAPDAIDYTILWRADGQLWSFASRSATIERGSTSVRMEAPDYVLTPGTKYHVQVSTRYSVNGRTLTGPPAEASGTTAAAVQASPATFGFATVAGEGTVTEGTPASFRVRLTRRAPDGGATVEVTVSETGVDRVASAAERVYRVWVPAGRSEASLSIPTAGDDADEPESAVTATVTGGGLYAPGDPPGATVRVLDDDEGAAAGVTVQALPDGDLGALSMHADGGSASWEAVLETKPAGDVTVTLSVSPEGHAAGSPGTTTFTPADWWVPQRLGVASIDGADASAAPQLTVTHAVAGYGAVTTAPAVTVALEGDAEAAPAVTGATGRSAPAFTVYHDPNAGAAALRRYGTAVELLEAAGQAYAVRTVAGTGKVDGLAGVSNSIMPRFFLGDPENPGWGPAQAKINNGGMRWLRGKLAALSTAAVSVADARVTEVPGAVLEFSVTLDKAATGTATVAYATADGTAVADQDYTAASGTLTFAAGERAKTVTVQVLDDAHDEGAETLTLTLSNPSGLRIADGTATGTIANTDPLQADWLARFGRAAAADAIATVTARLETPRDMGSHLTVAGQRLPFGDSAVGTGLLPVPSWSGDPAGGTSQAMSVRELLLGTSFRAVLGTGAGAQFTGWGQGASVSRFSSGGAGLSGETVTGSMGMDYERGRLLAGLAMTHSLGEGTAQGYTMGSSVTTMLPYARLALSKRFSAWGLAGTGTGRFTLDLDESAVERHRADLTMTLAAVGLRGDLLTPAEAGGFALALKADAFQVRTESGAVSAPGVGNLAIARADASRVRAALDGSRTFALAGARTLTPSVTLGLRHDGGDAETGTGMEFGAGLGYADPSRGLDLALRMHGLAAHADAGYGEWGVSGSLRLAPGEAGRGLTASLTPSYGATPGGAAPGSADRLWTLPDASGLAVNGDAVMSSRLDAEVGYGMAVSGGFTGTPRVGFGLSDTAREFRMGWRLSSTSQGAGGLEVNLDAARREDAANVTPEHRIGLGVTARW